MHQRCFKQRFYHDQHYLHRKSHLQWKTKQTKQNWYQEISQVTAVELKYAR